MTESNEPISLNTELSLMKKFDIQVHQLSFDYVEKCNDGKELEKIVKILRSGEEGHFPDLQNKAEERLRSILPNSRVLRVEEPVLSKSMLDKDEWKKIDSDMQEWTGEMKTRELDLQSIGKQSIGALPAVRSKSVGLKSPTPVETSPKTGTKNRNVPRNYAEWDKFDAEKELLKMEIEEEKKKEENKRNERVKQKIVEIKETNAAKLSEKLGELSSSEKQVYANQEKDRGNEYFKAKEFDQAVFHYTASIEIFPSPTAFNNRAMAYLKKERFSEAVADCNEVLKTEPKNVKALMRRATALQHLKNYQKALQDYQKILELEPDNRLAMSSAAQLKAKCNTPVGTRMQIVEEDSHIQTAAGQPQSGNGKDYSNHNMSWPVHPNNANIRVNEFGLAKSMCSCGGTPPFLKRPPPKCAICVRDGINPTCDSRVPGKEALMNFYRRYHHMKAGGNYGDPEALKGCPDFNSNSNQTITSRELWKNPDEITNKPIDVNNADVTEQDNTDSAATFVMNHENSDSVEKGFDDTHQKEKTTSHVSEETSPKRTRKKTSPLPVKRRPATLNPDIQPDGKLRVTVASKYTKSVCRGDEETQLDDMTPCSVHKVDAIERVAIHSPITSAYEFNKVWRSVCRDSGLTQYAQVLRRVKPADLCKAIGSDLDDKLLGTILSCLQKQFTTEPKLVSEYMKYLVEIPRFQIAKSFMQASFKHVAQELLVWLEDSGHPLPRDLADIYLN